MKKTYQVTMDDGSSFTVLAANNAKARTKAIDHLIYTLGMESWVARKERLSVKAAK